ncbi:hypothetical protein M9H77_18610 [Catharanthus roseus]|uniref:Uncharacterized protein n=1 Tax=Catharanthus roseus TaxID=4058 RepID=A0ACC0B7Z3_CATRO|nr:hypothetical protein M9H77_18610 [Catharanthus roseus]
MSVKSTRCSLPMGVDLEDPSCELSKDKEEDGSVANRGIEHAESGLCNKDSSMLSGYNKDNVGRTKTAKQNSFDGAVMNMYSLRELEPHDRMEFESKEDALSFYKEYAKSIGFSAIIKASRRSRISGKFIDAKFVCSRYGKKNESARLETPDSLPGADGTMNISTKKKRGRINRSWSKTDCKACMHVKKRQEGRWTICNLIKEHNHEIFPDQACCFRDHRNADIGCSNIDRLDATHSRTKKMYMSSQTGMSTMQRLESLTLFDKYMQRKTTLKEFFDQYKSMLKEKYEDEAKADFETWHNKPGLKSPSPFGKQMAALYTHAIFKKFQVEVLGVVACHPKKESEDGPNTKFKVQDFEENQDFIVVWNDTIADASCSCQLFEYNGFLCRHIMIVLQMFGIHNIPNKYILKRWTKNAKNREVIRTTGLVKSPVERYNDICRRVLKLGDEASLSLETYNIAFNALKDALRKCESLNCSIQYIAESSSPSDHGLPEFEEVSAGGSTNKVTRGTNVSGNGETQPEHEVVTAGMNSNWQRMEYSNDWASALGCYSASEESIQGMKQYQLYCPFQFVGRTTYNWSKS